MSEATSVENSTLPLVNFQTLEVEKTQASQFTISESEAEQLAQYGLIIEQHFKKPMKIHWLKDDKTNHLYILNAKALVTNEYDHNSSIGRYLVKDKQEAVCEGRSIGQKIAAGIARVIADPKDLEAIQAGDVIITEMTQSDWEDKLTLVSAIVTSRGGRTCHAAIVARELGIPAVVGCGDSVKKIEQGKLVTVSCAEGDTGYVYSGKLDYTLNYDAVGKMPSIPTKLMLNLGNPDRAFTMAAIPNHGVGLARLEFIINRMIGVHPKALLNYQTLPTDIKTAVTRRVAGYSDPTSFYVDKLVEGIATIGAAFSPKPVIVRMSDFKSNEYAHLIGGSLYEPNEENPMLGFRGASRYISESFRDCFALECRALRKVREEIGLTNVQIMIPFVRTLGEARQVSELLAQEGLQSKINGLKVLMMCELPANAILAEQFLEYFDGFSIGSNDLTQLVLGLDRDSALVAHLFNEGDEAVKALLKIAISACKKAGKYIGICGQGASDHLDFANWLLDQGIDSVSLNPDSIIETWLHLSEKIGASAAEDE